MAEPGPFCATFLVATERNSADVTGNRSRKVDLSQFAQRLESEMPGDASV